jgi:steroid delta-isomerase-like uncharacterized protein
MKDENILDQNKDFTRRFYEECWNQGKTERVDQYVAKDCRYRDPVFPSLAPGVESLKRHITMCRNAFPDLRFSLDDMIAERDEVVVHWTANGTQEGQFLGVAPTRKTATVGGTSIYRIKNQKIVEQAADWNLLTLLEQLGAATAPKVQVASR